MAEKEADATNTTVLSDKSAACLLQIYGCVVFLLRFPSQVSVVRSLPPPALSFSQDEIVLPLNPSIELCDQYIAWSALLRVSAALLTLFSRRGRRSRPVRARRRRRVGNDGPARRRGGDGEVQTTLSERTSFRRHTLRGLMNRHNYAGRQSDDGFLSEILQQMGPVLYFTTQTKRLSVGGKGDQHGGFAPAAWSNRRSGEQFVDGEKLGKRINGGHQSLQEYTKLLNGRRCD